MIEAAAVREVSIPVLPPGAVPVPSAAGGAVKAAEAKGFSFWDLLDVINPLQHIPIISSLYRRLSGDEISPFARIAGATLFGGPIGAAVAVLDSAFEHKTGRDIGATVLAALLPEEGDPKPEGIAVADVPETPLARPGHSFAPRVGDPIQLAPTFVAPAAPDLQALGNFATAAGAHASVGAPIALEPRFAAEVSELQPPIEEARAAPSRAWVPPAHDLPKGAARGLARQATIRAYAASAGAAVAPAPSAAAARALERETAEAHNDSIVDAMMRALDKYEASHRLGSASAEPATAVWR